MSDDKPNRLKPVETEHLLTTKEAIALVKKSERLRARWCLHVRLDAGIVGQPEHVFPGGLGHFLDLSRADALHLVSHLLPPTLEARGGRIRVRERASPVIGSTYWIG